MIFQNIYTLKWIKDSDKKILYKFKSINEKVLKTKLVIDQTKQCLTTYTLDLLVID